MSRLGPSATDADEEADLRKMDTEMQPLAAGIWDLQWVAGELLGDDMLKYENVLLDVYEDAVAEGNVWNRNGVRFFFFPFS